MARPPIELTDDQVRQIEVLAGYGLTLKAIAAVVGIHPQTLKKKREEERVRLALERGLAVAESVVGQALYVKAKSGDVSAIKWWEQTRSGRSEKVINENVQRDYRQQLDEVHARLRLVG